MLTRKFVVAALFLLPVSAGLMLAPTASFAQTNTTSLSGVVTDATGAVMPGVKISIADPATGATEMATSGDKGGYSFEQLKPGTYRATVNAPGFNEQIQEIVLLVSTPRKVNFTLSVGTTETVEVTEGLAEVNATDATLGKAFDSKQVQNLPYLANNITYLFSLQPGVLALDSGATTGGVNTDTRTGIVDGARQDQTNLTLDGVDNNDQTNGYAFNGVLRSTRESVEEFRVTTTNANADAGRSSGAQVSLVTRSGTNQLHGTAYEYYRDPGVSANDWFLKQSQLNTGSPNIPAKILQHTYGATLGLPLLHDKLFFFGAYEGFKQATDQVVTRTVPSVIDPVAGLPTADGYGGLITGSVSYLACPIGNAGCKSSAYVLQTLSQAQIAQLDPNCSAAGSCPNGPGTNAASIAYFKTFPLANSNNGGDGYNTGSYVFASPAPLHQITNIIRLDYNVTPKQTLFVRGNLQSDNAAGVLQFPGSAAQSSTYGNSKGIAGGWTWNLTNSIINNFRYGYVREGVAVRGTGSGSPYIDFSAFDTIQPTSTSSVFLVPTHNFADDMTVVKGRHIIQFGVNDRLVSNSRYADAALLSYGEVSPFLLATAAIAGSGSSLDPGAFTSQGFLPVGTNFRTFYNGAILANTGIIEYAQSGTEYKVQGESVVPVSGVPTHTYRSLEQEYYVQDQWKATPRLTLTAGVRYVYLGVPYEINGQQIAPTLGLDQFLARRAAAFEAGNSYTDRISFDLSGQANGKPNLWTPQKNNFAPRLAFAYATADNKTAIKGGFALAYDHYGQGVIDQYDSGDGSLFALSQQNVSFFDGNVDTNPRFTGYGNVPAPPSNTTPLPLPYTPGDIPFSFLASINSHLPTPYAETFNLTVQREVGHNLTVTASYVGRLGRHELANLDVAQPANLYDAMSGQTYFQAATAYDKMIDSNTAPANVPDSGYFHNIFPNFTSVDPVTGQVYQGAQAYYNSLYQGDRGNETDTLFNADTDPSASAGGQSFRFFYPQTSSIYAQSSIASSNYNALQLSMRQAFRSGLVYDFNYTYGKSLDEGSSPERYNGNLIKNTFDPHQAYAPSDFDVRHLITADYVLPFPLGRGTRFLNGGNRLVNELIGGIQLTGTVHYSSAFPFSATANGNYGTNFDVSSYFVQTGPIPTGGHHYSSTGHFESALKNGVTAAQATSNLRYAYVGETGQRNNFRADGYLSLDDGLSKIFHTFREQEFKITAEVFNVLNDPRFNNIYTNGASSTKFGQYQPSNGTTPGLLTAQRQMQFSGKYTF